MDWLRQYGPALAQMMSVATLMALCWRAERRGDRWERAARGMARASVADKAKTRVWRRDN